MKDFVYQMPVKVYFGKNSVKRYLKDELKHYGKNIMLAYGQESIKRNGIYDEVIEVLGNAERILLIFQEYQQILLMKKFWMELSYIKKIMLI
ncbi:hypothetical protein SD457_21575 [Coprobacillaceae bacterium CR2/5/TPMF4]|nr:hypothetical protein SD457_21575 [Coprobacillaceae bacterium CR2/5/TPMF4]